MGGASATLAVVGKASATVTNPTPSSTAATSSTFGYVSNSTSNGNVDSSAANSRLVKAPVATIPCGSSNSHSTTIARKTAENDVTTVKSEGGGGGCYFGSFETSSADTSAKINPTKVMFSMQLVKRTIFIVAACRRKKPVY